MLGEVATMTITSIQQELFSFHKLSQKKEHGTGKKSIILGLELKMY
jgi:hypothetical protein